jgi:serine/threonine protein kinase
LLYEMVAGEGPFDDLTDITQQMLAHLHRPPRPLRQWADLPPGLEALIERALAKHPDERPRSAQYMAAELAPFAGSDGPDPGTTEVRGPSWTAPVAPVRPSFPSSPSPSPASSPTPAGIVISTHPPIGVKLGPTWNEPTRELMLETRTTSIAVGPDPFAAEPSADSAPKRRAISVGVMLTLVAGLALAVFAFATPKRSTPGAPGSATLAAPPERTTANANTTGTTTANPTANAGIATFPVTPPTTSGLKPGSHRPRKRPAASSAPSATPGEAPIRLPPSGL